VAAAHFFAGDRSMSRPASYPLPLLDASPRRLRLRCEICLHAGASVHVRGKLLCGVCFRDIALNEEAKKLEIGSNAP
jgi:ribosomal protein S14